MKRGKIYRLSDEEFINLVMSSNNYSDILNKIGSVTTGNNRVSLKKRIEELFIDVSHFTRNNARVSKYTVENSFVKNSKISNQKLIKLMLENKLKEYKCESCNNEGNWLGLPITLQLHHIDGDNSNNEFDNLKILCPNCHCITDNFGSKNKRDDILIDSNIEIIDNIINNYEREKKIIIKCRNCNEVFKSICKDRKFCSTTCSSEFRKLSDESKRRTCEYCKSDFYLKSLSLEKRYCNIECYNKSRRKVDRPSKEELDLLLKEGSYESVGRKYGVSGKAVRKWFDYYNT